MQIWELPKSQYLISGVLSLFVLLWTKNMKLHACKVLELSHVDLMYAFNLNAVSMTVLLPFTHNLDTCLLQRFLMLM